MVEVNVQVFQPNAIHENHVDNDAVDFHHFQPVDRCVEDLCNRVAFLNPNLGLAPAHTLWRGVDEVHASDP